MSKYISALTTVEQEWLDFEKLIFSGIAPSRCQREETRRAFYAGACVMLKMTNATGDPGISEEAGCRYLDQLRQELVDFAADLLRKFRELN